MRCAVWSFNICLPHRTMLLPNVWLHACTHACTHARRHTCTSLFGHSAYVCLTKPHCCQMYVRTHASTHAHTHTSMHACTHARARTHMQGCIIYALRGVHLCASQNRVIAKCMLYALPQTRTRTHNHTSHSHIFNSFLAFAGDV